MINGLDCEGMGSEMEIVSERLGDAVVLRLGGDRLDAQVSPSVRNQIIEALDQGCKHLIVDLSKVSFIDSSGLGALISGLKNSSIRSARLVLAGVQPRVRGLFELTRLEKVFEMIPAVDQR